MTDLKQAETELATLRLEMVREGYPLYWTTDHAKDEMCEESCNVQFFGRKSYSLTCSYCGGVVYKTNKIRKATCYQCRKDRMAELWKSKHLKKDC